MMKVLAAFSFLAASLSPALAEQISAQPGDYTVTDGMTVVLA